MAGRFSVDSIFTASDRFSRPVAKMERRVQRFTRVSRSALGSLDRKFGAINKGIMQAGGVVAGAGAVAGAGVYALVKPAIAVEDELAKLATVVTPTTGTLAEALDTSRTAALEWSKQHVNSAEEFIQANYNMASAGLDATQALAGTRAALRLATGALGDAVTSSNLLATVYNNLGNKAADAGTEFDRIADVLAETQALYQIKDLEQLNESLKMGAPAAIQYGVSLEQLSTVLGALNTAGLQGSMAGTAFSATMRQMLKASKSLHFGIAKTKTGAVDFVGTLHNIEKKYGSFAKMTDAQKSAFQKAFGDEGLRAVALMLGKTNELDTALQNVTNSTGDAAAAQKKIESSHRKQFDIFKNRLDAIATDAGAALLPVFDQMAPEIESIVAATAKWVEQNKGVISDELIGGIHDIRQNLPAIAKWTERVGYGLAGFWTMSAAVKVTKTAVDGFGLAVGGFRLALGGAKGALEWIRNNTGAANSALELAAKANQAYADAIKNWSGEAGQATGKIEAMRAALNSPKLTGAIAKLQSKLGAAGLLAAAAGVGYEIGHWLDNEFQISEKLSSWLADVTGINKALDRAGGRADHRGVEEGDDRTYADGTIVGADGTIKHKGTNWQAHAHPSATAPVVVPPADAAASAAQLEVLQSIDESLDTLASQGPAGGDVNVSVDKSGTTTVTRSKSGRSTTIRKHRSGVD
jgi:TP901 family phage tail tape measure protein